MKRAGVVSFLVVVVAACAQGSSPAEVGSAVDLTAPTEDAGPEAPGSTVDAASNATATLDAAGDAACTTCGGACGPGAVALPSGCGSFGGAYEVSDPGCPSCAGTNAMSGVCGCPPAFPVATSARLLNDCAGLHGAFMTFCSAPGIAVGADWAGVYEIDDAVACSVGCRTPNPYTGACTCPAATAAIPLRTIVESSCGTLIGARLTLCLDLAAPTTTFGGAYQRDDAVAGGACRTTNPKTGACTCPAGTAPRDYRSIADAPGGHVGTLVTLCSNP